MKWRTTFLATLAVLAFAGHPGAVVAANPGPEALQPLVGDYVLVDRANAVAQRNASIDKVVDDLSFFIRPIARSRLRDGNPIPTRLSIRRDASQMTITFDGAKWAADVGGGAVKGESASGDPVKMTLHQKNKELIQRFIGEQGGKENVFRHTKSGVEMDVRVFSDRLPADVVYRLKFRR